MRYLTFTLLGLSWITLSCGGIDGNSESEDKFSQNVIVKNGHRAGYNNYNYGYDCENTPNEVIEILLQDGSTKKIEIPVYCNSNQFDKGDYVESQSSLSSSKEEVSTQVSHNQVK